MDRTVTLAVDAMGGDHGPTVTVAAALSALRARPSLKLLMVGDEARLRIALAAAAPELVTRAQVVHASQVVAMDESPSKALPTVRFLPATPAP